MSTNECSDDDLARALDEARNDPPRSRSITARALLRLEGERSPALLAESICLRSQVAEAGIREIDCRAHVAALEAELARVAVALAGIGGAPPGSGEVATTAAKVAARAFGSDEMTKGLLERTIRAEEELRRVDAALASKPVPPDASERVRRVAELRAGVPTGVVCLVCFAKAETRDDLQHNAECPYAPTPAEDDALAAASDRCLRCGSANLVGIGCASCGWMGEPVADEADGLAAEDLAAGWRWVEDGANRRRWTLLRHQTTFAFVGWHGWWLDGIDRHGPETGAAGKRAAVAHLRAAGVMGAT
jgi:hypothetical protein